MNAKPLSRLLLRTGPDLAVALVLGVLSAAALAGPGTQTEDDVYVGKKRQAQGATTPATVPTIAPKALLPATGTVTSHTVNTARSAAPPVTVQTRTPVQGVEAPGGPTPQPRPGAGTSPNTGRSAAPAPGIRP